MRVKILQLKPKLGNVEENCANLIFHSKQAASEMVDLICLPECFLTGYPLEDHLLFPNIYSDIQKAIEYTVKCSKSLKNLNIALPTPVIEGSKRYNAIVFIKEGKIIGKLTKFKLPNYGVFDEERYFKAKPNSTNVININGKQVLFLICEDIWHNSYVKNLQKNYFDYTICINASTFECDKLKKRLSRAKLFLGKPFVYINQVLAKDELLFDGSSFVLNAKGERVLQMKSFEEDIKTVNLLQLPKKITLKDDENLYKALVFGLKEYTLNNGFKGILIGLSGGIDSALCAKIAIDAVGTENVEAIYMPSTVSSKESEKDVMDFVKLNKIHLQIIPISQAFNHFKAEANLKKDISLQNLQSRIRGLILMSISNEGGKILITTGNKSEVGIGYCTLYGDTNGGYNPIKDIYKTEVFKLAKQINKTKKVFPKNIIEKPPTAELKHNQTDEASFGMPYKVLDYIIKQYVEEKADIKFISTNIVKNGLFKIAESFRRQNSLKPLNAEELVLFVISLIKSSQFKRMQSPPGAKVSKCGFGRDWRFGSSM